MNTAYNSIKTATDVTTTPTQQPEANKPEWIFLNQSRRILIRDMRIEQDGYPTKYWQLLVRGINTLTDGKLWNVPKYGAVIVAEKNIPWYFRYYNALKTQPARDIETIETEARKFRAGLEQRIKSRRKGFYYGIETSNTAEEYISVIIELYSAKARKDGNISEVEMHDIIGKQIRYAIEAFDKTGDRFSTITDMSIDFRNVASTYNNLKSVYDANHPATAPQPTEEDTTTAPEEATAPEEVTTAPEATAETPEKSEEEPEEEPAPATEATEDPEEVVFLKGAELDKVIAEYSERNGLDIEYQKKQYYFYATPDGYIVKFDKSKPKKDLYIADEGPFYESYAKGKVTDRDIFFVKNMKTLSEYARQRLESPVLCHVRRTMTGDLSIDPLSRVEYAYNYSKCGYEAIPAKHPTPRESAVYVAAWNAYEVEQRARLEKYWKRYGHKVWVNTYYADR